MYVKTSKTGQLIRHNMLKILNLLKHRKLKYKEN